jgi:hypothetical protein
LVEKRGKVVLINVNASSLVHHIQGVVDWPAHHFEESFELAANINGRQVKVLTKMHALGSGLITLPGAEPQTSVHIHFPDYALPLCLNEKTLVDFEKIDKGVKLTLDGRQRFFLESGIVKIGSIGDGQAAVIKAFEFSGKLCDDLKSHLGKHT